jgi:hypothetical protein
MAPAINELARVQDIPSFYIHKLFMPQKMVVPPPKESNSALGAVPAAIATPPPSADDGYIVSKPIMLETGVEALPSAVEPEMIVPKQQVSRSSYSSAVQAPPKQATTPELDYSGSTASESNGSEDNLRQSPTISKSSLAVNPNVPISKYKPRPCTLYYLAKNCKHGAECKFGHDYLLQPEHYAEIRVGAKKSPCPSKNNGEECAWGDDCCFGHICPYTTKCLFLKDGRCKFVGADMHNAA